MSWANKLIGYVTGNGAEVDATNRLQVNLATADTPIEVGGVRLYSENDTGSIGTSGSPWLIPTECDDDYRLRVAQDTILDQEVFCYTAQNTGKHFLLLTTMVPAWTINGMQPNSTSITTTATGITMGSWAYFPITLSCMTYCESKVAFSAVPPSNVVFDIGLFQRGAATAYAPTDGCYFRLTNAGMVGVLNFNGTETTSGVFQTAGSTTPWMPTPNQKYDLIMTIHDGGAEFWINDVLMADLNNPAANGLPCASTALPWSFRHINSGVAGGAFTPVISSYNISFGGPNFPRMLHIAGNGIYGSYQGLSGGTMAGLAMQTNSAAPTAAVAANGALTANLINLPGGHCYETATLAAVTDGILLAYQVPVGAVGTLSKRMVIHGVHLGSAIQTVLVGGPAIIMWGLGFGAVAANMAATESATGASNTTKLMRRVMLPELQQSVTAAQAVGTLVQQTAGYANFTVPIFVNPGEYVVVYKRYIGTAITGGVFAHSIQLDYGWE